jgi:hypothetical protein
VIEKLRGTQALKRVLLWIVLLLLILAPPIVAVLLFLNV